MATISCAFNGRTHYNNGWGYKSLTTQAGFGHPAFGQDYYGHHRCIVLSVTTPVLQKTYINRKLSINIPMCRSSAAGSGTDTFNYRITTTKPTFSEGGATEISFPESYMCSGTIDVYNESQNSGYKMRTLTTEAADFESDTTYYIWLWSDTPYVHGSYSYTGFYAHHASYGGLISVGLVYDIQQKSTLTVENGILGETQTLFVKQHDSTYTHTITYACGDASGTICTDSHSLAIPWNPPIELAGQNTTGTIVSIVLTIATYSGSTNIGSNSYTVQYEIPESVVPRCSITVVDSLGYENKYGKPIKGMSKLKVDITATTAHGSPIDSYNAVVNGTTFTTPSLETDVIRFAGEVTVTATVKDKRGRSWTDEVSKDVYDYITPHISAFSVMRCNADGTANTSGAYLKVVFTASVTPLGNKNTAVYSVKYKKNSDTAYTTATLTQYANAYSVSDGTFVFAADTASSYDVTLVVADDFDEWTKSGSGPSIVKFWSLLKKGTGIALGKIAELSGYFEVNFLSKFYKKATFDDAVDVNGIATFNSSVQGQVLGLGSLPLILDGDLNDYYTPGVWLVYFPDGVANTPSPSQGRFIVNWIGDLIEHTYVTSEGIGAAEHRIGRYAHPDDDKPTWTDWAPVFTQGEVTIDIPAASSSTRGGMKIQYLESKATITTSTSFTSTGVTVTIPAGAYFIANVRAQNNQSKPLQVGLVDGTGTHQAGSDNTCGANSLALGCAYASYVSSERTVTAYAKYASAASNQISVKVVAFIP